MAGIIVSAILAAAPALVDGQPLTDLIGAVDGDSWSPTWECARERPS